MNTPSIASVQPTDDQITKEFTGKIFGGYMGRLFGSWGAALNPAQSTSDLIEAPQHIIESIFQDELGIPTIDSSSIDAIATDRPLATWKFARSLTTQSNSLDFIKSICEEAALLSIRTSNGSERLISLANAASTSIALTSGDIALDGVNPLCKKYETALSDIYNQFYLNYKYDYTKNSYSMQAWCTEASNNLADSLRSNADGLGASYQDLCNNSQLHYKKVVQWIFNADWIRTQSAADALLKIMMNWMTYKKWIFEATMLYTSNTLKLELGDKIKINHSLLPSGVSNVRQFIVTRLVDGGMSRIGKIDGTFTMIPQVI